jgi:hypothetical protein
MSPETTPISSKRNSIAGSPTIPSTTRRFTSSCASSNTSERHSFLHAHPKKNSALLAHSGRRNAHNVIFNQYFRTHIFLARPEEYFALLYPRHGASQFVVLAYCGDDVTEYSRMLHCAIPPPLVPSTVSCPKDVCNVLTFID